MNDKNIYWKVRLDKQTEIVLKKIIKVKGITIQVLLEQLLKSYVYESIGCLIDDK